MAMREDKSDLRAKVYSLETAKESLEISVDTLQSQVMSLETQLIECQNEINVVRVIFTVTLIINCIGYSFFFICRILD